ncbi:MAG: ribonuclease P protein component [Leptospiraceae bacterium]|nr:ribonuclease P protein component [Leptospiraceae bacterium]MDW8306979.1 ribonuclease P protein component [Leptospiraceae bacterium]
MKQKEVFTSLKSKKALQELFTTGEKRFSQNLLLRYLLYPHCDPELKIVIAIPRDIKKAVERNRLKRVTRAALFEALRLKGKPQVCIHAALHVKKSFADKTLAERSRELARLFDPFYEK